MVLRDGGQVISNDQQADVTASADSRGRGPVPLPAMGSGESAGRVLVWDGCVNVRDLGGLPVAGGGTTRWGAVVRADNPGFLTPAGWAALADHGVRTIIGLRTVGFAFDEPDESVIPDGIGFERVFVEDGTDPVFDELCVRGRHFATPLFFRTMLERWPERCAAAVAAVATAPPGGVVISCQGGCDRTGLVALLLLALVGVDADTIAADWAVSVDRVAVRQPGYPAELAAILDREGATAAGSIRSTLAEVDVEDRLRVGGLGDDALAAVRARLGA
jgi:protein-tyrosine phosphatase